MDHFAGSLKMRSQKWGITLCGNGPQVQYFRMRLCMAQWAAVKMGWSRKSLPWDVMNTNVQEGHSLNLEFVILGTYWHSNYGFSLFLGIPRSENDPIRRTLQEETVCAKEWKKAFNPSMDRHHVKMINSPYYFWEEKNVKKRWKDREVQKFVLHSFFL